MLVEHHACDGQLVQRGRADPVVAVAADVTQMQAGNLDKQNLHAGILSNRRAGLRERPAFWQTDAGRSRNPARQEHSPLKEIAHTITFNLWRSVLFVTQPFANSTFFR